MRETLRTGGRRTMVRFELPSSHKEEDEDCTDEFPMRQEELRSSLRRPLKFSASDARFNATPLRRADQSESDDDDDIIDDELRFNARARQKQHRRWKDGGADQQQQPRTKNVAARRKTTQQMAAAKLSRGKSSPAVAAQQSLDAFFGMEAALGELDTLERRAHARGHRLRATARSSSTTLARNRRRISL